MMVARLARRAGDLPPAGAAGPVFGGVPIRDIRLASRREMPAGTVVRLREVGVPGLVGARIRLPLSGQLVDLGAVPIIDGEVVLADEHLPPP
jgi:hypothetical protein